MVKNRLKSQELDVMDSILKPLIFVLAILCATRLYEKLNPDVKPVSQRHFHRNLERRVVKQTVIISKGPIFITPAASGDRTHLTECGVNRTAVLLVGSSSVTHFEVHMETFLRDVALPLNPDVFAVTDSEGPKVSRGRRLCDALPSTLGPRLKALGLTSSSPKSLESTVTGLSSNNKYNATRFVSIGPTQGSKVIDFIFVDKDLSM